MLVRPVKEVGSVLEPLNVSIVPFSVPSRLDGIVLKPISKGSAGTGVSVYTDEKSGTLLSVRVVPTVTRVVIVMPETGRCLMSKMGESFGSSARNDG